LKAHDSQMSLLNSPGSYIPTVIVKNLGYPVNFSSSVVAGANGSYAEGDLTEILKFTYDVASKSISYETATGGGGAPPAP
ncbi:MAG TPA: hypothetical protein VL443_09110, partial [Cyclobacteriaceae bacterium]|nr:hypothetical protein [Cyclobacteriaceae bacterium]